MIYGVGIDIVRIDRIQAVVEKWGHRFLKKVFTDNEISYSYTKKIPHLSLAVRFAAKEALIKAIASEIPVAFTDIEIISTHGGKPILNVKGKLEDFFQEKLIKKAHVSLSHERDYGVACVMLEQ